MNDDELGRFLRDEVPAPGPGYWDAIDERLAAVGSDTVGAGTDADLGSVPEAGAPGPIDPDVDEGPETTDTGAEVIRLMDMTTRPAHRFRSAPVLVGAAAALVLLLGLGIAHTRGDGAQEVATDDGNPETETTELDADPTDDVDGEPTVDGTDGDPDDPDRGEGADADGEPTVDGTDQAPGNQAATRYCYAGGELADGVVSYADLSGPIESEPTVRIASRTVLGDETFYEVIDGSVLPDGSVTGQFTDLGSGARFEAMFVFVSEDGLSLADDVFVEPADCEAIADDIIDIETTVNSVDLDEIAIPQPPTDPEIDFLPGEYPRLWTVAAHTESFDVPGRESGGGTFFEQTVLDTGRRAQVGSEVWVELAGGEVRPRLWVPLSALTENTETPVEGVEYLEDDEEPRIWTILGEGTVDARANPGLDAEVATTYAGGESYLVGTGRRAFVDDQLWIQLEARPADPGRNRCYWVPVDAVEMMAADLRCYASQDWESEVLVIRFDEDAESFTGSLILRTSDVVTAEYFAAHGVLNIDRGSSFTVNVQEFGSPAIVTEEWRGVRDGFSLADRAFPNLVPCAFVVDSVEELASYSSDLIPPAPQPPG